MPSIPGLKSVPINIDTSTNCSLVISRLESDKSISMISGVTATHLFCLGNLRLFDNVKFLTKFLAPNKIVS